ncbi:MAG: hemerythrin domain-containing protein [Chloroflexota bacterium]
MEDIIALMDKIIEEHKVLFKEMETLETVANDAHALAGLSKSKEVFMPGRFGQKSGLQKLQELIQTIEPGLLAHFNREETALLRAFEQYGDKELSSALHSLLLEHEDLRNHMTHCKEHVAELMGERLSRHVWEAKAHDMRAHITNTRRLLETHALLEMKLFNTVRHKLAGKK